MLKKFYVFLVAVLVVLLAFGAPVMAASHPFKDVIDRYDEAIDYFYEKEIIKGKNDKEFGTYDNLKRGDAAVILAGALELDTTSAPDAGFEDVNNRVKGHVNALVHKGVINGFNDKEFRPDAFLTRGQMAAILVRAYKLEKYAKQTPFTDLSVTFKSDIEALYGAEITEGISATKYGTHEQIKRGDFVVLLYRTMNIEDKDLVVKSVNNIDPIHVAQGANEQEMNLPKEVSVVFKDDTTGTKKVQWNKTELDTNNVKEYDLQGTVEGTSLKASVKVVVHNPVVQKPNDIVVLKGTSKANLKLPAQVKLTYYSTSVNRNVTWNTNNLDLDEVGTYVVEGDIERLSRNTTIKVIVSGIDLEKLEDVYVIKGTELKEANLPGRVKLTYPDGSFEFRNVTWDTSKLDLETINEYVLTGTIADTDLTTTVKVIVNEGEHPSKVELDKNSVMMLRGTNIQLTAKLSPSEVTNKNVTWTSSNRGVATVDQNGKVTAVSNGNATITVTTANGKTDTAAITVVDDVIPYLEVDAKVGSVQGNRIKDIHLSIKNDSPNSFSLKKIEVFQNNKLHKTYTEQDIQLEGSSPLIAPNSNWKVDLDLNNGITNRNSFVILYISFNEQTFAYTRDL